MTEKIAQIVMGPAGTGKTTYCTAMANYCREQNRTVHIVNLDPAVVSMPYEASINISDLVSLDDVLEERLLGPNGGLVYCIDYFTAKMDWFVEKLEGLEGVKKLGALGVGIEAGVEKNPLELVGIGAEKSPEPELEKEL